MIYFASFLISVLMGMGVGGGGLFVIFLTLCMNYPQILAQGTNLLFFIIAGSSSLIYHLRKRKIVPWQPILMIIFGSIGSILSSRLIAYLDPKYPRLFLGALLIVSGAISLFNGVIKPIIKKFQKTLYK